MPDDDLPPQVISARGEIHAVIAAQARDLLDEEAVGQVLVSEWVLMVNLVDEDGEVYRVRLSSEGMCDTHTLGLLVAGALNGGLLDD